MDANDAQHSTRTLIRIYTWNAVGHVTETLVYLGAMVSKNLVYLAAMVSKNLVYLAAMVSKNLVYPAAVVSKTEVMSQRLWYIWVLWLVRICFIMTQRSFDLNA